MRNESQSACLVTLDRDVKRRAGMDPMGYWYRLYLNFMSDENFYTEAILSKLFADLTANFYSETADITAQLKQFPSDDHAVIWSSLFELEKEARLIREELMIDFHLHAELIKFCAAGLTKP